MSSNDSIPVLLDTDIGTDIDDAVCLAYLLSQPRCELLGITTVTGEAKKRAMLVDMLCRIAGRTDIPIHSGSEIPLLIPQLQLIAQQSEVLDRYPHRSDFESCTAVEFLRQTIRSRPGEITLLAIGPLTNIALLFAVDPEIPSMLKSLVLMCGVFTTTLPNSSLLEWNAIGDAHASAVVYNAPVCSHTSIGLDVTLKCRMDASECRTRFQGDLLQAVAGMAEVWFRAANQVVFHDPLAASVIFEPDICRYQEGRVDIELQSSRLRGMTLWNPQSDDKPHRIAVDVGPERFFEHYFSAVRR
jgi:inosine-uridine nucleoside N-ribohydrolase